MARSKQSSISASSAISPSHRSARASDHGWPLATASAANRRVTRLGFVGAPESQVGIDELRGRRQVDVGDPELVEQRPLMLELHGGGAGVAESELQLAERGGRPDLVQMRPELAAAMQRLGRAAPDTPSRARGGRAATPGRDSPIARSVCWPVSRASAIASR